MALQPTGPSVEYHLYTRTHPGRPPASVLPTPFFSASQLLGLIHVFVPTLYSRFDPATAYITPQGVFVSTANLQERSWTWDGEHFNEDNCTLFTQTSYVQVEVKRSRSQVVDLEELHSVRAEAVMEPTDPADVQDYFRRLVKHLRQGFTELRDKEEARLAGLADPPHIGFRDPSVARADPGPVGISWEAMKQFTVRDLVALVKLVVPNDRKPMYVEGVVLMHAEGSVLAGTTVALDFNSEYYRWQKGATCFDMTHEHPLPSSHRLDFSLLVMDNVECSKEELASLQFRGPAAVNPHPQGFVARTTEWHRWLPWFHAALLADLAAVKQHMEDFRLDTTPVPGAILAVPDLPDYGITQLKAVMKQFAVRHNIAVFVECTCFARPPGLIKLNMVPSSAYTQELNARIKGEAPSYQKFDPVSQTFAETAERPRGAGAHAYMLRAFMAIRDLRTAVVTPGEASSFEFGDSDKEFLRMMGIVKGPTQEWHGHQREWFQYLFPHAAVDHEDVDSGAAPRKRRVLTKADLGLGDADYDGAGGGGGGGSAGAGSGAGLHGGRSRRSRRRSRSLWRARGGRGLAALFRRSRSRSRARLARGTRAAFQ
jgi:hypothetical protein